MIELSSLAIDAVAEHDALRAGLVEVPEEAWGLPTPSPGWTVRDQISHLAFFDNATRAAVERPAEYAMLRASADSVGQSFVDEALSYGRELAGRDLLDRWQGDRLAMVAAVLAAPPGLRMPWFGPDMGMASALTARIMETWAHGQDVADCLGLDHPVTPRLRHVCDLGIRTRAFSFRLRGREAPDSPVRVELVGAPDGEMWAWGPEDAPERIGGSAVQFALVVTQRRHLDDTDLAVEGAGARAWLSVAQTFAGDPGPGRPPRRASVARKTSHEEAPVSEALDSAIPWVAEHTRKYVETGGAEGHLWTGCPPGAYHQGTPVGATPSSTGGSHLREAR